MPTGGHTSTGFIATMPRQLCSVEPGFMKALDARVPGGYEMGRIVERSNGEVHSLARVESKSERCSALVAKGPLSNRRGCKPVGLLIPPHVGFRKVLEGNGHASRGPL